MTSESHSKASHLFSCRTAVVRFPISLWFFIAPEKGGSFQNIRHLAALLFFTLSNTMLLLLSASLLCPLFHDFSRNPLLFFSAEFTYSPGGLHLFPLSPASFSLLPGSMLALTPASVRDNLLPKGLIQKALNGSTAHAWDQWQWSGIPYLSHVFKFFAGIGNRLLSESMHLTPLCALMSFHVVVDFFEPCSNAPPFPSVYAVWQSLLTSHRSKFSGRSDFLYSLIDVQISSILYRRN